DNISLDYVLAHKSMHAPRPLPPADIGEQQDPNIAAVIDSIDAVDAVDAVDAACSAAGVNTLNADPFDTGMNTL
ncbi:hypothetical protein ACLQ24_30770, partial [Micromonospora sp. DT4]|uniref:hypothetical protein n=1 Tax=Micromonospora sp. DT4 TaxID=3393438 RepID=UPI003CFB8C42